MPTPAQLPRLDFPQRRSAPLNPQGTFGFEQVEAASTCDGIIKGLKHPEWPLDPWAALKRLMLLTMQQVASAPAAPRATATPRLRLALNA